MNLVKCNYTKSNWKTEKCICKNAKLHCTTLAACSLENDAVWENQEIEDKRILAMSKTRLICFSLVLSLYRNELPDLQCKSQGWFLFNANFGLKWVEIFYFCSYKISPLINAGPWKCRAFGCPHWKTHQPLISVFSLISTAALNVALIRNITTF